MKPLFLLLITFCISITEIFTQDDDLEDKLSELFKPTKTDPFKNLVEVTTPTPGSITALEKCGEGSQEGTHRCVSYHQCDGVTKMIILDGSSNGAGFIDIRFGANACQHFLDICCGIPPELRNPTVEVPVDPGSPSVPSVTPSVTTVTSLSPPVTPVTPPPATPRPSSLYCGIRNPNGIDFKITGNKDNEAEYGEFPWMVAILRKTVNPSTNDTLSICGGSLIAPNLVLTGAHCVVDLKPNEYKVRAGEWDTQTQKERLPYQERDVVQQILHEGYTAQVLYNNVALLVLSSPFDQADNIGTICLPSQDEVITSNNCFTSGWGKDVFGKEGRYQVILKKIELPIVQYEPCQQALRRTRLGQKFGLHPSFICAGGEAGKDACTGDGGSPLFCPDPKNQNRFVQAGIVSWGIGCGEKNIPGVYANVVKFRNWIDNQLLRLNIKVNSYSM